MYRAITWVLLTCLVHSVLAFNPYIWHITDLHIDPLYELNYDANSCNEPLDFIGHYGNYECETPLTLHKASVKAMVDLGREPLFIIYSGDSQAHMKDSSDVTTDVIISYLENVTQIFNQSFQNTKFVLALGDYDYHPYNQLPGNTNPVYEAAAELWRPWFNNSQSIVDTFKKGGYYTQMMDSQLRVIVVNSNLYAEDNKVTAGQADPGGQYAWLNDVLATARRNFEQVHVVMHTPPGVRPSKSVPRWLRDADNTQLIDVITEFSDVIVGVYAGHEHFDTFRILYKDGLPVTTVLMAPSVSPWRERETSDVTGMARNPGIRKIFLDEFAGYLADLEQYYLDLPKANADMASNWLRLYIFTGLHHDVTNLTAPTLHKLVQVFRQYANNDFHKYYDYFSVGARDMSNEPCSCLCKFRHICSMENAIYDDFDECFGEADLICGANVNGLSAILVGLILIMTKLL